MKISLHRSFLFGLTVLFGLIIPNVRAQCTLPFSVPQDQSALANWNRVTYDGNWLLNSNGTGYVIAPNRIVNPAITYEGYGVNDYSSDSNFSSIALPKPSLPVIRVGKKFNQPGQGLLSPVRRADVMTFTFSPTAANCKIRLWYIGGLQEASNTANFYSDAASNFRREGVGSRQAALFGLFCRYDFVSPIPNPNTVSRAGRTEFGLSNPTSNPQVFTISAADQNYGLNDMISFYQSGSTIKTLPPSNDINKIMSGWDSYDMDFSEFVGQTVTVTLFAATSNYTGNAQNHAYCYYQFECLPNVLPTSNPVSVLNDIPTITKTCAIDPITIDIDLVNTLPNLLGSTGNVNAINNNTAFRWLSINGAPGLMYSNNFAFVKLKVKNSSGVYVDYVNVTSAGGPGPTDFSIGITGGTPAFSTVNNVSTYLFKVEYQTFTNPTVQTDEFTVVVDRNTVPQQLCTHAGLGPIQLVNPNSSISSVNGVNYYCPSTNANLNRFDLLLDPYDCTNLSGLNATVTYEWQRKHTSNWGAIAGATSQNLLNAHNSVYTDRCSTSFRRRITVRYACGDGSISFFQYMDGPEFTVINNNYSSVSGTSTLGITNFNSTTSGPLTTNIPLNNNNNPIILCYGDIANFNYNFRLGENCQQLINSNFPTNQVSVKLVMDNVTTPLYSNTFSFTGTSFQTPIAFAYAALNGNGFNFSGVTGSVTLTIRLLVQATINGCLQPERTYDYIRIQIFPRAIGGGILAPACPQTVSNDASQLTVAYGASANSGYTWQYCTQYTGTGSNVTCTGSWTDVTNQFGTDLSLLQPPFLSLTRPYIIRRVANSGNNCGGAQFSNSVEVTNQNVVTPQFNLPTTICRSEDNATFAFPAPQPLVAGNWYVYSPFNGNQTLTQLNWYNYTPGVLQFIFIPWSPALNDGQCYDNYIWTVTLYDVPSAGTITGTNVLYPLMTTPLSIAATGGVWSSSNTNVATIDPQTGVVTAVAVGSTTISYSLAGSPCPLAASYFPLTVATCNNSTTWDGSSWSNGEPSTPAYLGYTVIFTGNYNNIPTLTPAPQAVDLYACSVRVTNNAQVKMKHIGSGALGLETPTGTSLTVMNNVVVETGANLTFEDDTSLVQINNFPNSGAIQYMRRTPRLQKFDYTYWSSPVQGQNLLALSESDVISQPQILYSFGFGTQFDKYYRWDPTAPNWVYTPAATTTMQTGVGFIFRAPNAFELYTNNYYATFTGVPNNGLLTVPVRVGSNTTYAQVSKMNLIGNPYPSALDVDCFMADPANAHLNGTVYIWTHNIPIDWSGLTAQQFPGTAVFNYNLNSYAVYNKLGGVGTGIVKIDQQQIQYNRPNGKIAAGQSFFVEATQDNAQATFKNAMRVGSQVQANSQFFRMTPDEQSTCNSVERHRFWLHLINTTISPDQYKQTLIGYAPEATNSGTLDRDYDAKVFMAEPYTINLYSLGPNNTPLTIQGRQLTSPFNDNDEIPLGYEVKNASSISPQTITLQLNEWDGLFEGKEIYVKINNYDGTYTYHNLSAQPYTFTVSAATPIHDHLSIVFKGLPTPIDMMSGCSNSVVVNGGQLMTSLISNATAYRWWFIRLSDQVTVGQPIVTGLRAIALNNSSFPSGFIRYNEEYTVWVSVQVGGKWRPYGKRCRIKTENKVNSLTNCNVTIPTQNTAINTQLVSTVPGYRWKVTKLNAPVSSNNSIEFTTNSPSFTFTNSNFPASFYSTNSTYAVQVRPINIGGIDNLAYGPVCNVTTPLTRMEGDISAVLGTDFTVTAAPNPFASGVGFQVVQGSQAPITVRIYSLLGQEIEQGTYTRETLESTIFGQNLPAGIYEAVLVQDEHQITVKLIKE